MACIIDANVAIHLRDGDAGVTKRLAALGEGVPMSIVTRGELECGVYRVAELSAIRRARLDVIIVAILALAHRATLITMNAEGFSDIPSLALLDWG